MWLSIWKNNWTYLCHPSLSQIFVNNQSQEVTNRMSGWPQLAVLLQVNLFQKHLFLYHLTHNMTKDCSLNYEFSTWKFQAQNMLRTCWEHVVYKNCFLYLFWYSEQFMYTTFSQHVLNMFASCSELGIFMYWTRNVQSVVILWVNWCKNNYPWQIFTCTDGAVDHGGTSSNEREPVLPRFGMSKGVVQKAGHILWKGKYVDQNEFYKVRPFIFWAAASSS